MTYFHLVLILVLIAAPVAGLVLRAFFPLYSLERYRSDNPHLFKAGRVTCKHCGGTSTWMKRAEFFMASAWAHTCRTCGKELYYSRR